MISIRLSDGPASLQGYAARENHYDEHPSFTPIKQDIRECLCSEQGYICGYCMSRIEPDADSMQIAHIVSQATSRAAEKKQGITKYRKECQYKNMLGSCSSACSCNQAQKDHDLKFSPTDLTHPIQRLICFDQDGTISSADTEFDNELNQWLKLNSEEMFFKQNRAAIYHAVVKELRRVSSFDEKKSKAKRLLNLWKSRNNNGKLQEYCGVAIWLLEKKLTQWG